MIKNAPDSTGTADGCERQVVAPQRRRHHARYEGEALSRRRRRPSIMNRETVLSLGRRSSRHIQELRNPETNPRELNDVMKQRRSILVADHRETSKNC